MSHYNVTTTCMILSDCAASVWISEQRSRQCFASVLPVHCRTCVLVSCCCQWAVLCWNRGAVKAVRDESRIRWWQDTHGRNYKRATDECRSRPIGLPLARYTRTYIILPSKNEIEQAGERD